MWSSVMHLQSTIYKKATFFLLAVSKMSWTHAYGLFVITLVLVSTAIHAHPMMQNKNFAIGQNEQKWRPFNSMEGISSNEGTLDMMPSNPVFLHGQVITYLFTQYKSFKTIDC